MAALQRERQLDLSLAEVLLLACSSSHFKFISTDLVWEQRAKEKYNVFSKLSSTPLLGSQASRGLILH